MNQKMNQLLDGQSPAPPSFTEKQGQYLAFIWAYTRINGRAPAERDLQHYFGVTPPSAHQMVLTLESNGLIRRQKGVARSIELLVDHNSLPTLQPVKSSVQRY
jgi:DNA-binding MarR family transcriptional regulator